MTPNPTPDPRAVRTRRLLTEALFDLVGRHPYPSVSVKAIAEAAGVNRATFYAHFVDKDDAVRQGFREGIDRAVRDRLPEGTGYREGHLGALVLAVFEFVGTFVEGCRRHPRGALPSRMEHEIDARVAELVRTWVSDRRAGEAGPTAPVSERIAAVAIASAVTGAAWDWARQHDRPAASAAAGEALVVVSAAFEAAVVPRSDRPLAA